MSIQGDKTKLGLVLSGQPLPLESANIFVTQPKIKDIVLFGENDFLSAVQMLTKMEDFVDMIKKGNIELEIISDFQLLMTMINQDETVKSLILNLFTLIFPDYRVNVTENSIDFLLEQDDTNKIVGRIHPFNFEDFQTALLKEYISILSYPLYLCPYPHLLLIPTLPF